MNSGGKLGLFCCACEDNVAVCAADFKRYRAESFVFYGEFAARKCTLQGTKPLCFRRREHGAQAVALQNGCADGRGQIIGAQNGQRGSGVYAVKTVYKLQQIHVCRGLAVFCAV